MATRINKRNFESEINKIVNDIIPGCKNLFFHVGYFYFSGFSLIAKSIENKNIKILVGMEADQTVTELSKSKNDKRFNYLRKLSEEVDKNEILDKPEERDSYFIFKKKIQDGSLEVRQTKRPSHTKEFIFEYETKFAKVLSSPGQSLVGSPNLTEPGFITNQELATLHTDKEFFNEAKQDLVAFVVKFDPADLKGPPPEAFGKFYVLVDECHRTQGGDMNRQMKRWIQNGIFLD